MPHTGTIIRMRNVPGHPKLRALTRSLSCLMPNGSTDEIPCDFKWDGASTPWFLRATFPRHNHPVASCKHDYRCGKAKNANNRAWADMKFKEDVLATSWKITAWWGYAGVRVGALFGVGSNF